MEEPARGGVRRAGAIPALREGVKVAVDDAGLKAVEEAEPAYQLA